MTARGVGLCAITASTWLAAWTCGCGGSSHGNPREAGSGAFGPQRGPSTAVAPHHEAKGQRTPHDRPHDTPYPTLTALTREVRIIAAPRWTAPVLGTLRAGQSVTLASATPVAEPPGRETCKGGWFAIQPRGYLCASDHVTTSPGTLRAQAFRHALPNTQAAYPYHYGHALGSPRYLRIPSREEQRRAEPGLDEHLARVSQASRATAPAPSRALTHYFESSGQLRHELDAYPGMKLAWTRELTAAGRVWVLTSELMLVPKDKVTEHSPVQSMAARVEAGSVTLPFAMVLEPTAKRADDGTATSARWTRGELVPIAVDPLRPWNAKLLEVRGGGRVSAAAVSVFEPARRPSSAGPQDKWVSVRVNEGTLLAYEGAELVFAAAVSAGIHGASPGGTHRTPPGRYRISSKAITADMSGETDHGSWRTRDVPWVAYYDGSFALHGAWWHDDFGRPRSHGCINLAPADARWLFRWLEPALPKGWYAVRADPPRYPGTLVVVRP